MQEHPNGPPGHTSHWRTDVTIELRPPTSATARRSPSSPAAPSGRRATRRTAARSSRSPAASRPLHMADQRDCSCQDRQRSRNVCKHMRAVRFWMAAFATGAVAPKPRRRATAEDHRIALTPDGADYLLEQAEATAPTAYASLYPTCHVTGCQDDLEPGQRIATVINPWMLFRRRRGEAPTVPSGSRPSEVAVGLSPAATSARG